MSKRKSPALTEIKTYRAACGSTIRQCATEACALAKKNRCHVVFEFNGVECRVLPHFDPQYVIEQWESDFEAKP